MVYVCSFSVTFAMQSDCWTFFTQKQEWISHSEMFCVSQNIFPHKKFGEHSEDREWKITLIKNYELFELVMMRKSHAPNCGRRQIAADRDRRAAVDSIPKSPVALCFFIAARSFCKKKCISLYFYSTDWLAVKLGQSAQQVIDYRTLSDWKSCRTNKITHNCTFRG